MGLISEIFNPKDMKWFLVKYIYEIISGGGEYQAQFDEQLRLVTAESTNDALIKAEGMAQGFHPPFKNFKGELVEWRFICIAGIHEIETPADGAEVGSTLHEPSDVPAFLGSLNKHKEFMNNEMSVF